MRTYSFLSLLGLFTFTFICCLGFCLTAQQSKALVILDDWNLITTHSLFFSHFEKINYDLEFKMIDEENIKLDYFGEKVYDSIILMIPSFTEEASKNTELAISKIISHFDQGHNIMIFANEKVNSYIRGLSNEFGIDFDDYDSSVKDSLYLHSHKKELNEDVLSLKSNEIILSKAVTPLKNIFTYPKGFILYEGIGLELDTHNSYLFSILKADDNTYSVDSNKNVFYNVGERVKLVAGYQGRNNKRVVVSGSLSMCSNKFYFLSNNDATTNPLNSPNAKFCQEFTNWNLEKTGVLKYDNVRHSLKNGVMMETYKIKEELEFFIDIYEYDYISDTWKPYLTDDLQVEFLMMDPFYRLQLRMLSSSKPTYYVDFKAPDKWGVFKFNIDYNRIGYSYLHMMTKVPLRPYKHNEYARYLQRAYPYYTSVFITIVAFVLFSLVFLFSSNK